MHRVYRQVWNDSHLLSNPFTSIQLTNYSFSLLALSMNHRTHCREPRQKACQEVNCYRDRRCIFAPLVYRRCHSFLVTSPYLLRPPRVKSQRAISFSRLVANPFITRRSCVIRCTPSHYLPPYAIQMPCLHATLRKHLPAFNCEYIHGERTNIKARVCCDSSSAPKYLNNDWN